MTAERRESMLIAVESSHGFDDLRALVKRYLDSGIPSGQLLEDLSQIRALVPDDVEETVLDVMDLLVGWCAPAFKLSSRETDEPSLLSYNWIVSSYGPGAWLCMPSWGGDPLMTRHLAFYSVVRITRSTRTANLGIDGLNGVVGGISDSGSHVEYAVIVAGESYMIDSADLIPTGEVLERETLYGGDSMKVDPQRYADDE
jgi:hypothetical protein